MIVFKSLAITAVLFVTMGCSMSSLRSENAKLRDQLDQTNRDLDRFRARLDTLKLDNETYGYQFDKSKAEVAQLIAYKDKLEAKIEELRAATGTLQGEDGPIDYHRGPHGSIIATIKGGFLFASGSITLKRSSLKKTQQICQKSSGH